jgi:hypothetical protein
MDAHDIAASKKIFKGTGVLEAEFLLEACLLCSGVNDYVKLESLSSVHD